MEPCNSQSVAILAASQMHLGLCLWSGAFTLCSVLTDAIDGQQVSMQPDCLSQPLTYPPDLCFLFWREWSPELQSTNADSSSLQNAQVTPPVIPHSFLYSLLLLVQNRTPDRTQQWIFRTLLPWIYQGKAITPAVSFVHIVFL